MSDEIYDRLVFDGAEMTSLLRLPRNQRQADHSQWLVENYAMTGWRLGFAVWPEHMTDAADSWRSISIPVSMPRLSKLPCRNRRAAGLCRRYAPGLQPQGKTA